MSATGSPAGSWALGADCPSCQRRLTISQLRCSDCGIAVEGPIVTNEFAVLTTEELHLLRIFVRTEGRLRDMEAALGISYPTVKARLRKLRETLRLDETGEPDANPAQTGADMGTEASPGGATDPSADRRTTHTGRPRDGRVEERSGEDLDGVDARASTPAEEVLAALEEGDLSYAEALQLIRKNQL